MLRILVSNDDGINAPGLRLLVEALLTLPDADVYVAAPCDEKSGVGHGITYRTALAPKKHDFYGLNVKAWEINGTPADCVKAAYHLILADQPKPDIVFSGINVGNNLGRDVYYSGTCSAAREAVILGTPGVAFSYDNFFHGDDFGQVGEIVRPLLRQFMEKAEQHELPPEVFWNVNIPHLPLSQIKGVKPAILSFYHYDDQYQDGDEGYWLQRLYREEKEYDEKDDYRLLKEGYVTVTPIHIDATDRSLLDDVADWPVSKSWGREGK